MTRYQAKDAIADRKNTYMPCGISARFEAMTAEEKVRMLKATRWCDLLTAAEWPVMMGDVQDSTKKSRLKTKMVGWLMALGHIAELNPELWSDAFNQAASLYQEQFERAHPVLTETRS